MTGKANTYDNFFEKNGCLLFHNSLLSFHMFSYMARLAESPDFSFEKSLKFQQKKNYRCSRYSIS